jgi:Predicted phosphohydrolase
MNIYGIGDLHLSRSNPKPMDIFGANWTNHWDKIRENWNTVVNDEDLVLIPGDISWALRLEEALPDIMEISEMPGKKIMIEGNHDYWWQSASKIRRVLPDGMSIIQNDYIDAGDFYICGTRGWMLPGDERFKENDMKVYNRELIRLNLSLSSIPQNAEKGIIVMLHFPPFNEKKEPSDFVDIIKKYNVKKCIYGHLHGMGTKNVFEGVYDGIEFFMVSCDYLDFKLKKLF